MQIMEVISYSAKVGSRIIRGISRTYADSKKSAKVSRTFEDSFSPRKSAIGLSASGLSRKGILVNWFYTHNSDSKAQVSPKFGVTYFNLYNHSKDPESFIKLYQNQNVWHIQISCKTIITTQVMTCYFCGVSLGHPEWYHQARKSFARI